MQRLPHVARNSAQGSWTCLWRNELKDSGVQRKCKQCIQLKVSRRYIGLAQATCPRNNEVLLLRWGGMRHTTWHPVLRAYVGQNSMLLEIWRLQATVFKLLHQRLSCWKHGFKINHVHLCIHMPCQITSNWEVMQTLEWNQPFWGHSIPGPFHHLEVSNGQPSLAEARKLSLTLNMKKYENRKICCSSLFSNGVAKVLRLLRLLRQGLHDEVLGWTGFLLRRTQHIWRGHQTVGESLAKVKQFPLQRTFRQVFPYMRWQKD